jgi:outer membrane protein assembly factor BamB
MIVGVAATSRLVHPSISNGMMGMMLPIYAVPALCLALVAAAAAGRHLPSGRRRAAIAGALVVACGVFTLLRTEGITGEGDSDLHWRWTLSPEERLLARAANEPPAPAADNSEPAAPAAEPPPSSVVAAPPTPTEPASVPAVVKGVTPPASPPAAVIRAAAWPGFRGPDRDSNISGVRIATDWPNSPPVEVWRRAVGPGWSSFAVRGDRIYTQEQRGDEEIVACYSLSTGAPLWRHRDAARFWESNGGAGPRGTPTLDGNRVYTFGATGILNALDAATGAVVWSRNAAADHGVPTPGWGFSSSPLVVEDAVIVAISGVLAAYDRPTGNPRWVARAAGGGSYSSPHLATIDGVPQVLLMAGGGLRSVAPADGALLWEHAWPGSPIVQPALIGGGDVLISTSGASGALGMRRLAVSNGTGGWTVAERWTSNRLKPYFNDFVVHEGHAYGFDGFILAAINLEEGERKWKGGRYGNGQLLLLPEQDLLLVLSEEGELALVSATPDQFTELARFPAIKGKTWNHPVLAGDLLLVRNGEEMAAFRLPIAP